MKELKLLVLGTEGNIQLYEASLPSVPASGILPNTSDRHLTHSSTQLPFRFLELKDTDALDVHMVTSNIRCVTTAMWQQ